MLKFLGFEESYPSCNERLQVLNIFVVVTVEDLNLESVLLLKLKVHNNFTDKLRI